MQYLVVIGRRLFDVIHRNNQGNNSLYLVFEFMEVSCFISLRRAPSVELTSLQFDFRKYMDNEPGAIPLNLVKVLLRMMPSSSEL